MDKIITIDCFPEATAKYRTGWAIVAIDVIRASTVAVTACAQGRRCIPVASLAEAYRTAGQLGDALLAGEEKGDMPAGFHMNNSPAELARRMDVSRPLVMLSSSGTKLMCQARGCDAVYLACFRNFPALTAYLANRHNRIAIIGAGSRGEFREEDQMCCAWLARDLLKLAYSPADPALLEIVERWRSAPPEACAEGKSANYLRRTNQTEDLDFILASVGDLDLIVALEGREVVPKTFLPAERRRALAAASAAGAPALDMDVVLRPQYAD